MPDVPVGSDPLQAFAGLLDLERSLRFHEGRETLGLDAMRALVAALPVTDRPRACVHVAGSEGKTSVTERVAAGITALGLRVGTYTSPHLKDPRERMRVDGRLPEHEALRPVVAEVLAAAERAGVRPSWFEAMTATAYRLFGAGGPDSPPVQAAVWETGLGGRLDATSVLPADVCVITSISKEHTAVLGRTEPVIAREKAGILRPGAPVVVGPGVRGGARDVVRAVADELSCPWHAVDEELTDVQRVNTALALRALECLHGLGALDRGPDDRVRGAVASHRVAGRFDLRDGVLYDGAHSVAACEQLAARLQAPGEPPTGPVVLGVTAGRDAGAMAKALRTVARPLILTRAPGERGVDPIDMAVALGEQGVRAVTDLVPGSGVLLLHDPKEALEQARQLVPEGSRIVVTGSLHLVGLLWPTTAPTPGTADA